jgi:hypothetical protein
MHFLERHLCRAFVFNPSAIYGGREVRQRFADCSDGIDNNIAPAGTSGRS